jgi:chemotaxis family two-component system sensor kinase Cph1
MMRSTCWRRARGTHARRWTQSPALFAEPALVHAMLDTLAQERRPWRGELGIVMADGRALHVGVRAEVVPARDGSVLGFFLIFDDLTQSLRAAAARRQLEQSLSDTKRNGLALDAQGGAPGATDDVMSAVLANASIAAMDISDGGAGPSVASLLEEIDHSAQRAATLYGQIRAFRRP